MNYKWVKLSKLGCLKIVELNRLSCKVFCGLSKYHKIIRFGETKHELWRVEDHSLCMSLCVCWIKMSHCFSSFWSIYCSVVDDDDQFIPGSLNWVSLLQVVKDHPGHYTHAISTLWAPHHTHPHTTPTHTLHTVLTDTFSPHSLFLYASMSSTYLNWLQSPRGLVPLSLIP